MEIQSTTGQFARQTAGSQNNDQQKASLQISQPLEEARGSTKGHMSVSYAEASAETQAKTESFANKSESKGTESKATSSPSIQIQSPINSQQVGATVDHLA